MCGPWELDLCRDGEVVVGEKGRRLKLFLTGFFFPSYGSHFELNLSMYEAFDTKHVLQVCFGLLAYREVQGTDPLVSSRTLHGFLFLKLFFSTYCNPAVCCGGECEVTK